MHALLLFVVLQSIAVPRTNSVPPAKTGPALTLKQEPISTTPFLTPDTALHLEMERELGGQGEAIGELRSKVATLEQSREKIDRPDINSLQTSRTHVIWTIWLFVGVIGTLGSGLAALWRWLRKPVWHEMIKPRITKVLAEFR